MSKKWIMIITCILLLSVQGCERKSNNQNENSLSDNKEYNLLITNNTPLLLKSIVVKLSGDQDKQISSKEIDALIDSNIKTGGTGKFYISEVGEYNFKITLNPKNNYSVSEEFKEDFGNETIIKYEVVIEQNEIKIQKVKSDQ